MKFKKACLLLSIVPLLVSCKKAPYTEYIFQMGKSKDTHMSVSLKLFNELYDAETPEKGDKFELDLDMLTSDVEDDMSSLIEEIRPLTGFYKISKEEKVYNETRLNIGLNIMGEYEIPKDITDFIFVASITNNLVNFYLPVSIEDLQLQLYWYGFDFNISDFFDDESEEDEPSPVVAHDVGTHPTKEDIDYINKNTDYVAKHSDREFRDFHVLKLGLTKQ